MNAGVSSTGFELASNREIDLNTLSNVQIMVYTDRVRALIEALDMKEDEFLADGILRIIDEELSLWSRSYNGHVSFNDVEKLWSFVKSRFSHKSTNRCNSLIILT